MNLSGIEETVKEDTLRLMYTQMIWNAILPGIIGAHLRSCENFAMGN